MRANDQPASSKLKMISPKEAHDLLEQSAAVIADDNLLCYPELQGVTGDPDHTFLKICWVDDEDFSRVLRFTEGDNKFIKVSGTSIFPREHEADEIQITPLRPWNLE